MRARRAVTAAAVAGATAIAIGIGANAAAAAPSLEFEGSCTLTAPHAMSDNGAGFFHTVDFHANITGDGSCSGSANGAQVSKAPASVDLNVAGRTSCIASMPDSTGSGTLTVAGTSYPVRARLVLRAGMFFTITISGTSGSASGTTIANLPEAITNPHSGLACLVNKTTEATLEPLTLKTSGPLVLGG